MTVRTKGETFILWLAVDQEGIELDVVLQRRRDKTTTGGYSTPRVITTDKLKSYV